MNNKKFKKFGIITFLLVLSACLFIYWMDQSTVNITPDKLNKINIDVKEYEDLINIEKGTLNKISLVDKDDKLVTEIMLGKQYYLLVDVDTLFGTVFERIPIDFVDTSAPIIEVDNVLINIPFGQTVRLEDYVKVRDNYDQEIKLIYNFEDIDLKNPNIIQPMKITAKDSSKNESHLTLSIQVEKPICASDGYWNGENCICNHGYQGDGWNACVPIPKINKPLNKSYNYQASLDTSITNPNNQYVNQKVDTSDSKNQTSSLYDDDLVFEFNDEYLNWSNSSSSACEVAANTGQGRPENAVGWACIPRENEYVLVYYDSNDSVVASIGGF